ncbi:DUF748 domain-containing protein [Undibacterium arcticum]|uniref:DUF748 domain-containing protein n=1 Tax=Undibacterium arcticum TaxID=1762892 RepID=UPI00360E93A1
MVTVVPDQASAPAEKSTATVLPGGVSAKNIAPPTPSGKEALIRIGQTTLQGGNINFTDNFVKPNYSANLTNMGGSIGALSSRNPQPAAIDLRGRIDSDAPVQISGSLNPLFKPLFLDVKASAKNIELTRLTPYAAKYAGYAIDKGKLSMNVAYHIENDTLTAQNHLNLDQLTFGEKMDSPDATKLPVHLAVALLKNGRGEIDINLPVSGTLSDPQFSIGGIVFRLFMNLIAKAVTSPFALLSSAFGGGEELAYAEFTPGLATLTPATQTRLDTLTKALKDRPALRLDITGWVDPQADLEGIREAILSRKIRAMKRKDASNQNDDAESDDLNVPEADKAHYLERIYKDESSPNRATSSASRNPCHRTKWKN